MHGQRAQHVVLFDGVCNFCNSAVLFIVDRDRRQRFRFAALQSDCAQRRLAEHGEAGQVGLSTLVLLEGDRMYTHSDAALRVARQLDGLWPLLYPLVLVPRRLRDWAYRTFAARRYRWFGRLEACRVPTPELRARFLDV